MNYGKELILDLHGCNAAKFNRKDIKKFFVELCRIIDMKRCKISWWDDVGVEPQYQQALPHTKGTSAIQFILTSNITIHTLDMLKNVYINIFSCKDFDSDKAGSFARNYFNGIVAQSLTIDRI
jgi:S-adenosylmethionine decarboxylase